MYVFFLMCVCALYVPYAIDLIVEDYCLSPALLQTKVVERNLFTEDAGPILVRVPCAI